MGEFCLVWCVTLQLGIQCSLRYNESYWKSCKCLGMKLCIQLVPQYTFKIQLIIPGPKITEYFITFLVVKAESRCQWLTLIATKQYWLTSAVPPTTSPNAVPPQPAPLSTPILPENKGDEQSAHYRKRQIARVKQNKLSQFMKGGYKRHWACPSFL